MKRGTHKWIPPRFLEELDSIMEENKIKKPSEGFIKIIEYCKVGREMEKVRDRFFLQDLFKKKKR